MPEQKYALYVTVLGSFSIRLTEGRPIEEEETGEVETTPLRQRGFLQYLCVYHPGQGRERQSPFQ